MQKTKNIHTLDSLEREIYRLRLEIKKCEEKMDTNFDYLHEHFDALLINSISGKMNREKDGHTSFIAVLKSQAVRAVINKTTGHFAGWLVKGIEHLACRFFRKEK